MSDPLAVTPESLRDAAEDLYETSSKMKNILSELQNKLAAEGPKPWGDDSIGDGFDDGPDGYSKQVDWVQGVFGNQTAVMDQLSEGMEASADSMEHQDD